MSHPLLEGRLLVLAELAFSMFVLLGTLEAAARWVTPQPVEEMRDAYLERMHRLDDPCPALSSLGPRVPGKRRLAVVGESNGVYLAMGMERIAESCPALGWEIVTCAEAAVGPIDAGRQLDQLAGADVDEVVVIGNNPMAFYPTPSMARDVYEALVHSRVLARFLMPTALVSAPPMAFYEERWERVFASIDVMRRRVPVKVVEPHVQPWVFRGPSSPQSERAAWWLLGGERARAREALRTLGDDAVTWRALAADSGDETRRMYEGNPPPGRTQRDDFLVPYRAFLADRGIEPLRLDRWTDAHSAVEPAGWDMFFDGSHLRHTRYEEVARDLWPEAAGCQVTVAPSHGPGLAVARLIASTADVNMDPARPYSGQRFHQASLATRQALSNPERGVADGLAEAMRVTSDAETVWGIWDGWHQQLGEAPAGMPAPTCSSDGAACVASLRAAVRRHGWSGVEPLMQDARRLHADRAEVVALEAVLADLRGGLAAAP